MTQRAFVQFSEFTIFSVSDNEPGGPTPIGEFSADGPVNYVDTNTRFRSQVFSRIDIPADASSREIENMAVAVAIAQQPAGFNLTSRDVVVIALDRG